MRRFGVSALVLGVVNLALACSSDDAPGGGSPSGGAAGAGAGGGGAGGSGGSGASGGSGGSGGSSGSAGSSATGGSGGGGTGGTSGGGTAGGGTAGQSGSAGTNGASGAAGTNGSGPLPQGNNGIARRHPNDSGIGSDPEVIFSDDFEGYTQVSQIGQRWDNTYQNNQIRIATEPANVYAGAKALEFNVPQQTSELSNATDKIVSPERDVLYLRYYSKFFPPYDVVGSSHNGSMISAHYFNGTQATPGVRANGTNKFLVNLENWRGESQTPSPGHLNVYVYHPAQRDNYGDHFFATGLVMPNTSMPFDFGPNFVSRPDFLPALDRWYCYEYMVQANTPGVRDGRIAFWVDGELLADFQNLRLRDVATLKIDRFGLSFHIGSNPNGATKKWYDNVVAATSYIGPIFTQ
jgi:hypothetical protein